MRRRPEPDALGLLGGGRDHQVGRRARLVADRVVLGEEDLGEPELVCPPGELHVPVDHLSGGALPGDVGGCIRRGEESNVHGFVRFPFG